MYVHTCPELLKSTQPYNSDLDPSVTELNELYFVIHHSYSSQLLLHKCPKRGQLPCLQSRMHALPFFFERTDDFLPKVQQILGLSFEITLLRCIWYKNYAPKNSRNHYFRTILVLESHGDCLIAPVGLNWTDFSEVVFPTDALTYGRLEIDRFLAEQRNGMVPLLRAAYARRGWFSETVEWVRSQIFQKGFLSISDVRQVRCTWHGCVLKVRMVDGRCVYLKCSPPFINEAATCMALVKIVPEHVEEPIAADTNKRLLLMRDYGEIISTTSLADLKESQQWAKELFHLQYSTINCTEVLLGIGLQKITLSSLPGKLNELLENVEHRGDVSQKIIDDVRGFWSSLINDCETLDVLGLPETFVHADLLVSNIHRMNGSKNRHGIIDFADSIVSHPFIDGMLVDREHISLWTRFLEKQKPDAARRMSSELIAPKMACCWRVQIVVQLVKLYNDLKKMESPPPPEVSFIFKKRLRSVVLQYKRAQSRENEKQSDEKR